ncbi:hypothetical protein KCG43_20255 [Photobacterium sp. WH24]|nr:hypothetical protein [Photobacterium sp. WH24]
MYQFAILPLPVLLTEVYMDTIELLEEVQALAACGSEAATNWEQGHLTYLFMEIERKIAKAKEEVKELEGNTPI